MCIICFEDGNNFVYYFAAWWRWQHKYVQPKRAGIAPFFHVVIGAMGFFYLINYGKISKYLIDLSRAPEQLFLYTELIYKLPLILKLVQ